MNKCIDFHLSFSKISYILNKKVIINGRNPQSNFERY